MSGAKTEAPTRARVQRARGEGDTGASAYAARALGLVVALALVPGMAAAVGGRAEGLLREAFARVVGGDVSAAPLRGDAVGLAKEVALLSLPVVAGVAIATAAAAVVQAGGLARRRQARGAGASSVRVGEIFSRERAFAIVRTLAGGAIVGWIVMHTLRAHAADVVRTSGRLGVAGGTAAQLARREGWQIALAGLAIAAIDVAVMRALWWARLRMSRDEIVRERREMEGDPLIRAERARERDADAARGAKADVARARVVVWDGDEVACALRYDEAEGDRAPVVVATTRGRDATGGGDRAMAGAIVDEARAAGVAVRRDGALARALADSSGAGETIPEALFDPIADLLRDIPGR